MSTCLGKSCSFGLPRVPFVNCCQLLSIYAFSYFPFGFEGRMWDLIVSVPDHCLSFYFSDVASTLAQFVISQRTFLAWMLSIIKKCHQNVFLSIVQIMPG